MAAAAVVVGAAIIGAIVAKKMAPKPPNTAAIATPEPVEPAVVEAQAVDASKKVRQRNARGGGRSSTIMTGPGGLETGATYEGKTLLGS